MSAEPYMVTPIAMMSRPTTDAKDGRYRACWKNETSTVIARSGATLRHVTTAETEACLSAPMYAQSDAVKSSDTGAQRRRSARPPAVRILRSNAHLAVAANRSTTMRVTSI